MTLIVKERSGQLTPFGKHGKLKVEGIKLIDENNNPVRLRGISTHNLSSYPEYINKEAFTQFVDEYGVNIMRLAMYSAEADDTAGYSDGNDEHRKELEQLILKGVDICAQLGIYCLVDWHILFDYDPNFNKEMAAVFFKNITPLLKSYDNVIYEICNEPNKNLDTGEECSWDSIRLYANEIIPIIRNADPSKIIIVGTPVWSQNVDVAAQNPLAYDNLMYTLHFYADTHRDEIRQRFLSAINNNLPIFVTEFGLGNAAGDGEINDEETESWFVLLNKYNISYIIWNLSNKKETSSILTHTCIKTKNFTDDDLSECGKRMKELMKI